MSSRLVRSRDEFRAARAELTGRVGAVLTMGALHSGHEALLAAARADADAVVTTVFVNPTQFGPAEDLAKYPRTLAADVERISAAGAELIWAPDVADIYPRAARIGFDPGPRGADLEGAARPTHFAGVLLVVNKFLHLIDPAVTFFGEKDYQQLTLVRAMVTDLEMGIDVIGVPTVREPDGLALSSRNVYLTPPQRRAALALSRALFAGRAAGPRGAEAVLAAARSVLATETGIQLDYLALRTADLGPTPARGPARLLVAARVGETRLIDNVAVEVGQ